MEVGLSGGAETKGEAIRRENEIKSMKNREYIEQLVRASRAYLANVASSILPGPAGTGRKRF